MLSKWSISRCAINGTRSIWSPWWLWQWWSNSRIVRNGQRKREVFWNPIVNGRGTLGLLKYDRPRQRRTFCNAMWLLLSVSNTDRCTGSVSSYSFRTLSRGSSSTHLWALGEVSKQRLDIWYSLKTILIQIWSDRLIYGYRPIDCSWFFTNDL